MKILFLLLFSLSVVQGNYLLEHSQRSVNTKEGIIEQYITYNNTYNEVFLWYKNEISKKWPRVELSNKHYFVKYQDEFRKRITIDFRNGIMELSIISDNEKEVAIDLAEFFDALMKLDVTSLYKTDILFNQTLIKLNKQFIPVVNDALLVGDIFKKSKQKDIHNSILQDTLGVKEFNETQIYSVRIKFSKEYKKIKEKTIYKLLKDIDTKLPKSLLYAQIKYHSGYNFYARNNLSFGLLAIEPIQMGVYTYHQQYGYYRFLDMGYFYDFYNNLNLGILHFESLYEDLKYIEDTKSKIYLVSLVYKYDYDEIFEAFGVNNTSELVREINKKNSARVYKILMKKIKNKKIRNYLFRIAQEMLKYKGSD